MSIVLLRCSKCGNYSTNNVKANAVVDATLDAELGVFRSEDIIYADNGIPLENFIEAECDECDGSAELVTLGECPHRWRNAHSAIRFGGCPFRYCMFCHEEQVGRAVFDDEEGKCL